MKKALTPFRVGLLVMVAGVCLFIFLTFVRKGGLSERDSIAVFANFRDATGLGKKSRVQIAGITVGEVADIELIGTRAKVSLRIRRNVALKVDASVTKRSESLLGDYLLDINPGTEPAAAMPENGEIKKVIDAQGMEQIFGALTAITADIQQVTSSLREVLGGEKGQASLQRMVENLIKLAESVDKTIRESGEQLNAILRNFEGVSQDVRGITEGEQATIRDILKNVDMVSRDTRDVLATVKQIVGSGEGELKESVASIKETLHHLDETLKNVEELSENVKAGKGVAGALLANERLGQRVSDAVEDVADLAQRVTGVQTEVGITSNWMIAQGSAKNSLGIRLIPKPDKYYLLEFVDDPRGSVQTVYIQSNPPSQGQPVVQKQTTTSDRIKFSAQFAKRFSFTTLRFGIIESTGGVGADFSFPIKFFWVSHWIEDALVVKVDAFNFSVEELNYPRLRATVRLVPYNHIYINAGLDDSLNRPVRDLQTGRLISGRDVFLGAGIFFTDDDLKSILSISGIPKM